MPDQSHNFSSLRPNHEARKLQALFHSELCILFWVGSTNTWLYIYILVLYIGGDIYFFQGGKSWWYGPRIFHSHSLDYGEALVFLSAGQCGTTLFQKSSMELSCTKFYSTLFSSFHVIFFFAGNFNRNILEKKQLLTKAFLHFRNLFFLFFFLRACTFLTHSELILVFCASQLWSQIKFAGKGELHCSVQILFLKYGWVIKNK